VIAFEIEMYHASKNVNTECPTNERIVYMYV